MTCYEVGIIGVKCFVSQLEMTKLRLAFWEVASVATFLEGKNF